MRDSPFGKLHFVSKLREKHIILIKKMFVLFNTIHISLGTYIEIHIKNKHRLVCSKILKSFRNIQYRI